MSVTHRMESQRGHIGKELNHGLDRNNKPWANFSLAVDVDRVNDQGRWEKVRTDWYQVAVFGAQARNVAASLRPGDPVVVSGDVETQSRMVDGPNGPELRQRQAVRASMVAPDLILTPVSVNGRGIEPVGPGMQAEANPYAASDADRAQPGPEAPSQPSAPAARNQYDPDPTPAPGDAAWPSVAQPGTGQVSPR